MPNHVKNRITFENCSPERMAEIVAKIGTHNPEKPNTSCDGEYIYIGSGGSGVAWLDPKTGVIQTRKDGSIITVDAIPEGFVQDMQEEFTEMPDFNKVIPTPINIFNESLGREDEERCKRENRPTWSDWNRENWGTKWGGYSHKKVSEFCFEFQTAWSKPTPVIYAISGAFPDIKLIHEWADEDTGYNCGKEVIISGEVVESVIPEGGSVAAYEQAFALNPDSREYYELKDGAYVCID